MTLDATHNPIDPSDPIHDVLDALSDGIAIFDRDRHLVTCNQRYIDMFPLVRDMIRKGVRWDDLQRACMDRGQIIDPFDDPAIFMNRALSNLSNFKRDIIAQHSDGKSYQVSFAPTKSGGYVVCRRENAPQVQAQAMVRDRENLLATVMDTIPVAVTMTRFDDGKIIYRSQSARELFGDTANTSEHYAPGADRRAFVAQFDNSDAVDGYQMTLKRHDGTVFPALVSGRIVEHGEYKCIVAAVADITEQLEREALIRHVLNSCPTPIQMNDAQTGAVLFSSPDMIALFGDADSSLSMYVDLKDRERQLKILCADGATSDFKARFYNHQGQVFWGSVSARMISYNGRRVIVSHTRDLTEQMQIEEKLSQQQDQLFQNEKMSALSELLAGVAHELNNPLSVVVGHSMMLREDTTDPEVLRQIDKISTSAERCAGIVKTFLTMARQQPSKTEETNINDIVRVAVDVARHGDLSDDVELECDLAQTLPTCCVDGDQITQVVLTLVLNSEHAIRKEKGKGKISVQTGFDAATGMIQIAVQDNGPGIPSALKNRIFEPFFTTKETGQGTGIGLSLSHRIMQSHNGQIILEKSGANGTRFLITIPALNADVAPAHSKPAVDTKTAQPLQVLIVDDEVDVADLNAEILTRAGFEVDVVNAATEGLARMKATRYDLVLSDLNMPGMDGRGFFDTIKAEFPELVNRIGFITGDTMGKSSQSFLKEAQRSYLEKPASPKELRAFVAEILDAARSGR
ncbi:MAG: ATP-binding protein [Sulfitobacter sp.]